MSDVESSHNNALCALMHIVCTVAVVALQCVEYETNKPNPLSVEDLICIMIGLWGVGGGGLGIE